MPTQIREKPIIFSTNMVKAIPGGLNIINKISEGQEHG